MLLTIPSILSYNLLYLTASGHYSRWVAALYEVHTGGVEGSWESQCWCRRGGWSCSQSVWTHRNSWKEVREPVACSLEVGQSISAVIWNCYKHFCLQIRHRTIACTAELVLKHSYGFCSFGGVYSQTKINWHTHKKKATKCVSRGFLLVVSSSEVKLAWGGFVWAYQLAMLPSRSGQDSAVSSLWALPSPDCRTLPSILWLPANTHRGLPCVRLPPASLTVANFKWTSWILSLHVAHTTDEQQWR